RVCVALKLRPPAPSAASALGSLAPYLSFGPTVLFPGGENAARVAQPGSRNDGPMAIGLSWGAGLSWRFTRNAELFGGYRFMQFWRAGLLPGDPHDAPGRGAPRPRHASLRPSPLSQ